MAVDHDDRYADIEYVLDTEPMTVSIRPLTADTPCSFAGTD